MAHKISLAGWSLHRRFQRSEDPLQLIDFPRVAKEEFGLEAIELNSPFFPTTDEGYLDDLKGAAEEAGVRLVGMAVDGTGDPSSLDEAAREESIERILPWFGVAKSLDLPFFRVNTGGAGMANDAEALNQCIKSFRMLAREAEAYGVRLAIENHWGLSSNPENIVRIIEAVGSDFLGTLPDFGNFPDERRPEEFAEIRPALPGNIRTGDDLRYWGLERMAPYAFGVHAKMLEFDEAGNEARIDVARCVEILKKAGFDGYWGIEFEGSGDEEEGVRKSKALLERVLG